MKILVVSDRFVPEIAAPSFRIMDHAREWLKAGHEVIVVTCAPNFPRGTVFPGYRNRWYQEENLDGIRVVRVWSYMAPNRGIIRRSLDYLSFLVCSVLCFRRYPDFDVIVATSPPIFVALSGWLLSVLRRRPWVFELRDLWPATMRAVGVSGGGILRLVEKMELFLYRRAHRIVALTNSFRQDLSGRGIHPEKIDVVTNGVDPDAFRRDHAALDARALLGVGKEQFLAGYVGTVGMCHGLTALLDAARLCLATDRIRFLVLGEGAERKRLEEEARRTGAANVLFHDFVPHEQMPSYIAALDAAIVHLRPDPLFKTVIPSKIFEFMAMNVPIILAVEGESAEIVSGAGCGICIRPGDPAGMADAVKRLAGDPALRAGLGAKGRLAVEARYSRRANAASMIRSLQAAIDAYGGRKR